MRPFVVLAGLAALFFAGCTADKFSSTAAPPPAPREFRAAWVATVANIDWPSKPGLPVEQLRAEMTALLDRAQALHFNAIILQVRPAADALYPSALEPWTEYLSGEQGRAPAPGYDPLAEWVAGAHRRGMELHAWFNPYRARHQTAKSAPAATHIARTHPEAVKTYGELLWMDPAEPAAVRQTLAVVRDVVRRYDLDGVHIDDYFYPYPVTKPLPPGAPKDAVAEEVEFPDEPAWKRYRMDGGTLGRADWRRQNVDQLVHQLYRSIHAEKSWVKFGISPFGVGRPGRRPAGVAGFSQYDKLYADVELWLERGWLDYLAPQLYWPRDSAKQPFAPLLDSWLAQNTAHRHVWPGLFTSAINDTAKSWSAEEIVRQVDAVRARPAAGGHIHYSLIALLQDRKGVATRLQAETYPQAALVPVTGWLGGGAPRAPLLRLAAAETGAAPRVLVRMPRWTRKASLYAVWTHQAGQWHFSVQPVAAAETALVLDPARGPVDVVVVSAVDRLGYEGARTTLRLGAAPAQH